MCLSVIQKIILKLVKIQKERVACWLKIETSHIFFGVESFDSMSNSDWSLPVTWHKILNQSNCLQWRLRNLNCVYNIDCSWPPSTDSCHPTFLNVTSDRGNLFRFKFLFCDLSKNGYFFPDRYYFFLDDDLWYSATEQQKRKHQSDNQPINQLEKSNHSKKPTEIYLSKENPNHAFKNSVPLWIEK